MYKWLIALGLLAAIFISGCPSDEPTEGEAPPPEMAVPADDGLGDE